MMEVIKNSTNEKEEQFYPMNQMGEGRVCYCAVAGEYILAVNHSTYLILGSRHGVYSYGSGCTLPVRDLHKDESVTIRFS